MDEKRGFIRFRTSFPFKSVQEKLPAEIEGMVKDINMNGLRVVLDKSLSFLPEELSDFCLCLSDGKVLKISGEVIWQKNYMDRKEVGIRFVHISNSYKEDIHDYIFKYHQQEMTQRWWQM